jgi:hypothetical protein
MGNQNRKASKSEMTRIFRIIKDAFPEYNPIFGGHGDYGGHRVPRDHTISFRLKGDDGKFHSNVIWLMPNYLNNYTVDDIKRMVNKK